MPDSRPVLHWCESELVLTGGPAAFVTLGKRQEWGSAALTPEQHDRLAALTARDRRLVVYGSDHAMIREDEQLRAAPTSALPAAAAAAARDTAGAC
ncbi:hypothetical protein [Streptomyces sp. NPDC047976]|uniref:hypothetical protein n=1 Tax=Streptomyces sp. NPDC047976 TaxID=3155746 RepID=UPI003441DFDD